MEGAAVATMRAVQVGRPGGDFEMVSRRSERRPDRAPYLLKLALALV